jgi:hypothetical protein
MAKRKATTRMKLRIDAFDALKGALLPGFCEGMECDADCPLFADLPGNEPCAWQKTYTAIGSMRHALEKYGSE